jgi:hypothetical protein
MSLIDIFRSDPDKGLSWTWIIFGIFLPILLALVVIVLIGGGAIKW